MKWSDLPHEDRESFELLTQAASSRMLHVLAMIGHQDAGEALQIRADRVMKLLQAGAFADP